MNKNNETKKFNFLFTHSLLRKIKSKAFIISNIITFVIILIVANLFNIVSFFGGDFSEEHTIYYTVNTTTVVSSEYVTHLEDYFSEIDIDKQFKLIENTESFEVDIMTDSHTLTLDIVEDINDDGDEILDVNIKSSTSINFNVYSKIESVLYNLNLKFRADVTGISDTELEGLEIQPTIDRTIIDEDSEVEDLSSLKEVAGMIVSYIVTIISFIAISMVIQMFGAEILEEKVSGTVEVTLSNVKAGTHLFSKLLSSNVFIMLQGILSAIYFIIGSILAATIGSSLTDANALASQEAMTGAAIPTGDISSLLGTVGISLIYSFVMFLITIILLQLIVALLASKSKDQEDFAKKQGPLFIALLLPFYGSLLSSMFIGSNFIKILAHLPVFSLFLSGGMFVSGHLNSINLLISFVILSTLLIIIIKVGLKSYKSNLLGFTKKGLFSKLFNKSEKE